MKVVTGSAISFDFIEVVSDPIMYDFYNVVVSFYNLFLVFVYMCSFIFLYSIVKRIFRRLKA
ncbi:hypothetical protein [Anaerocolumna sp.]|uniref:hypothetical protein n=1 Tax=Anaerocolumna sp. TaxID=2041569 RepID=UPI0028A70C0F|nr:hypothetical protein [Anaerocolumna sp.]